LEEVVRLETRLVITKDTRGRTVVLVQQRPWDWGGPRVLDVISFPITLPLVLLSKKKVIFDNTLQRVVRYSRFLFWLRRKEIPFSDIQSVDLSYRTKSISLGVPTAWEYGSTPVSRTKYLSDTTVILCDLNLILANGENFYVGTGKPDPETKAVGQMVAEVTQKPFVGLPEEKSG
jgi:hypothetical protein